MEDILKLFMCGFIAFMICMLFFIPTIDRVESLEKLHNEYICLDCGTLVKK